MSIENQTIKPIDTPEKESAPNLSEQLKVQRKSKLEKRQKKIRSDLKAFFSQYKTGPERIKAISDKLEPYLHILSTDQRDYILNSVKDAADTNDENEFIEKMSPIAQYYFDIKYDQLDKFEVLERERIYKEHPTYKELNQLFAYELEEDEVRLHVPSNEGTSIKDKLRLIDDGLKKLAEMVRNNPNIKRVVGRSWIVGENPKLLERLSFEVSDVETNPQGIKVGMATISREKLIELYGK